MTAAEGVSRHGMPRTGRHGRPGLVPRARDDTTRYLCAAVHMDADYADNAVREFLVEDTRPVSVSPGVDAAAVLGEAIAARTRRKFRDGALLLLVVALVFFAPPDLLTYWTVAAILIVGIAWARARRRQGTQMKPLLIGGGLALLAAMVLVPRLLELLGADSSSFGTAQDASVESAVGTVVVVAALLAVLLADRLVVWKHLSERFWPNRLSAPAFRSVDRPVFQCSPSRQLAQLRRYTDPRHSIASRPDQPPSLGQPVPLIVYRDFVPFVGAGEPKDPWSIAVPLERLSDIEPPGELTTAALYDGIRAEVDSLRAASTLAPGRRLGGLDVSEVVIVSADELIDHLADPATADFLRRPGEAPFTMISRNRAQEIRSDPLEWARYYQCYRVETWDRDLVVTVFVHVAVGRGALYVEWTPCVLSPIKKSYQRIDQLSRSPLRALGQALSDLVRLPASIPTRLFRLLTILRPMARDGDMIAPETYGVSASLRELAADPAVHNYFQLADVDRYLKVLESRLTLAVSRMMRAAGYSPASFDQQAAAVVNNNIQIAGSVNGNVVAGTGNQVEA